MHVGHGHSSLPIAITLIRMLVCCCKPQLGSNWSSGHWCCVSLLGFAGNYELFNWTRLGILFWRFNCRCKKTIMVRKRHCFPTNWHRDWDTQNRRSQRTAQKGRSLCWRLAPQFISQFFSIILKSDPIFFWASENSSKTNFQFSKIFSGFFGISYQKSIIKRTENCQICKKLEYLIFLLIFQILHGNSNLLLFK